MKFTVDLAGLRARAARSGPEVGDVYEVDGSTTKYVVVHRHSDMLWRVFAFERSGKWRDRGLMFAHEILRGFSRLHTVGFDGFFYAGEGPQTKRPYVIFKRTAGAILRAGCRSFTTYAQAARHWRPGGHSDAPWAKRDIARAAFDEARRRGWLKVKRQPPVKRVKSAKRKR